MADYSIDTQGLLCPMPVIRAQDKVEELQAGDRLEVLSSDPGALNDIPAWCRINGHTVLEKSQEGRAVRILIEVGSE
ncbi:MAG: sulfurtransferase TusA family protein [Gammaproteobacteria bacterium]|jgi:tRNA 2-thiouridine synthesizing protein A|nr:sulfurtransferase TusA family protein [Gammaproteobacteria bacterium]MBT4605625.1 sulfurtransferase TusA family protein [Thiotrichales bacterium]MBT3471428.1 sulfurtransferase TusA family protein [Gammaproteobacteria bacterium]MBT3966550.1 sulfurtransferase TusA family protein [Gammaproteobacteria bacterium]MBT4079060.1 sulfurtransferase TusA family protein [Gammaproteobacteria bacterium]